MKKKILIATFDMEVGGVERSLISMLENFDYEKYDVDLMLYSHRGDLMKLLPVKPKLLKEIPSYATFRKSILQTLNQGHLGIAFTRVLSKITSEFYRFLTGDDEPGYYQMQLMWKYSLPLLPKLKKEYDVAISYLWPHYFVGDKVNAKKKIAWIHTDYSNINTKVNMDIKMWSKFDHIIAVSEACKNSFLNKYNLSEKRVEVIENINSQEFINIMSEKQISNPMLLDNRFKLLTVARLSHAKGIDNAVRALALLQEKGYKNIVWYIVGYGGDEAGIRKLINQYHLENYFILLGKQPNPYPYIQACDVYIQPSRYEGKAVTVTEAKILGKPILITNYPTAKSQVNHGVDGVICDLSPEGLTEGIELMYNKKELRSRLVSILKNTDFSNQDELNKLYNLIG